MRARANNQSDIAPRSVLVEGLENRRLMSAYYLSPSGNDNNAGTSPTAAWKTIARANQQTYHPGDWIMLQGGASFSGDLKLGAADAGTQASPVTVTSFGSGRGTISAGSGDGIDITNAGGINIVNINVEGDGTNVKTSTGIELLDTQVNQPRIAFLIITAVDVGGFGKAGIGIYSNTVTTGFEDVTITNCTVHSNGHSGIWSEAGADVTPAPYGLAHQSIYIGYDTVYDNQGYAGSDASGNGIELGNANWSTIEHCTAYGNGADNSASAGGPVGIWTYNSNSITIQYNTSYSNVSQHLDGDGFDIDGGTTNSVLQYNYSYNNDGIGYLEAQFKGGSPQTGNVIRYNISADDGRQDEQCAIMLWAASSSDTIQGTQIYNNTIYMAPAKTGSPTGILIIQDTINVTIRNNIFDMAKGLNALTVNYIGTGLTFQGNDYWTGSPAAIGIKWGSATYQSLASWRAATGEETLSGIAVGQTYNPELNIASSTQIPSNTDVITGPRSFLLNPYSIVLIDGIDLFELGINPGPTDYFGNPLVPGSMSIGAD